MVNCFFQIIHKEFVAFLKILRSKMIDLLITTATTLIVFGYLLPSMGMAKNYGPFILAAIIPLQALFEAIPRVSGFVADIGGDRKISYWLTLPLPSWLVFAAMAISWSLCSALFSMLILPLGKLIFYSSLDLSQISIWRFLLLFLMSNLFCGFFALWLSGMIRDIKYVSILWARIVNPIFMFGCYFYSWKTLHEVSAFIAYLDLLNPLVYATEGMRLAILGGGAAVVSYGEGS
jgi:ABC-2 type transport system permease protein